MQNAYGPPIHDGDDLVADKPASRPIAKALPYRKGPGFFGQFGLAGLVPDYVKGADGRPRIFRTEREAEEGALRALFQLLVSRTIDTRKAGGYLRMTGAELGVALDAAQLTPTFFAELYGVPQARVMKWLDGEQDIPHSAHVLVRLLVDEKNFKLAREITEQAQEQGDDNDGN
jgi:hypothetical protein